MPARYYTRAEAAEALEVTVRTVDNYLRDGVLTVADTQHARREVARRPDAHVLIPHRDVMEVRAARKRLKITARRSLAALRRA